MLAANECVCYPLSFYFQNKHTWWIIFSFIIKKPGIGLKNLDLHNLKLWIIFRDYVLTSVVTGGVVAHEAAGGYIGWWTLLAPWPVDALVGYCGVLAVHSIVVCYHLKLACDWIQVQHWVVSVSLPVLIYPHMSCYAWNNISVLCERSGTGLCSRFCQGLATLFKIMNNHFFRLEHEESKYVMKVCLFYCDNVSSRLLVLQYFFHRVVNQLFNRMNYNKLAKLIDCLVSIKKKPFIRNVQTFNFIWILSRQIIMPTILVASINKYLKEKENYIYKY